MTFDRVTERLIQADPVLISSAVALFFEVSSLDQLGYDLLGGALRNPNPFGQVSQSKVRMQRQTEQRMPVIAEKCPSGFAHFKKIAEVSQAGVRPG